MLFATMTPNHEMLPVFLGILLAAAIAWLYLSNRLYAELRRHYPEVYRTLGSPGLFMKRSFSTNFKVIRFLFRQNDAASLEPAVRQMCQGLRALFYIYIICLAGSLIIIFDKLG